MDSEQEEWNRQEDKGTGRRLFSGIKGGLALFVTFPFIVILLPLWYVHRWNVVRSGRPAPEAPWAVIFARKSGNDATIRVEETPLRARRPYEEENRSPLGKPPRAAGEPLESLVNRPESGKVALVTGGARRLGAHICLDLAAMGYRVAVVYHRSAEEAHALVEAIRQQGNEAEAFALDLSRPAQIGSLLNTVERQLGPVSLLINNAALFLPTPIQEGRWEVMSQLLQVNLQGPLMLAMSAITRMGEQGGLVINLCDIWGERPLRGHAAYGAAKAGLIAATQALAREAAPNIRVNAIAPGAVLAPEEEREREAYQKILARTPLARDSSPDAVLQAVRYLLAADYVTGEVLHVDGGRRLV